jgi:hypothetical protein
MWIISIFEEKKKSRVTENILTITIQKALWNHNYVFKAAY